MRLLVDTHALMWFSVGDPQLSAAACQALSDAANETFVSPASHWELAIRIGLGKLKLHRPFLDYLRNAVDANGFQYLPITPHHTVLLTTLPHHHRDPFDRLLIAQADAEGLTIVSNDGLLAPYGVPILW